VSNISTATGDTFFTSNIDGKSVAVKDGATIYHLGFQEDSTSQGLNVFGHNCCVSGASYKASTAR
jgi:hypothetical protein